MKERILLVCTLLLLLTFAGCSNGRKTGGKMSEMEQLKYDNALSKLEVIYAEVHNAEARGERGGLLLREKIRSLKYDFDSEGMSEDDLKKCRALKERIDLLKDKLDAICQDVASKGLSESARCRGTLLSKRNMELSSVQRFPYYLNEGDTVSLSLDCQGEMTASFYNINRQTRISQWKVNSPISRDIPIKAAGIYMLELKPAKGKVIGDALLTYTGSNRSFHPHVKEKHVVCTANDFLAVAMDSLIITPVFNEPVKIGLRGNLQSLFSGKSRSVVPVHVAAGCDELLYSFRISTNEKTVDSDGKFPERLSVASHQVKLLGVKVYESSRGSIIDRLLGNTRPPCEEDAFCNMYVFTDKAEAKRFQDRSKSSGNYKYDVDQSRIGTQSCNGRLYSKGRKTLYLGFENARMRYDNYIWLEMVALKQVTRYTRPIYTANKKISITIKKEAL